MRNKKIIIFVFILFLLVSASYALYTARHILLGPRLMLEIPDKALIVQSQVIEIVGTAQNTTELRLNNLPVLLTEDGSFSEKMLLSIGNNIFIFNAKDKFGRGSQEVLQVVYTPKENAVLQLKDADNINNKI